MSQSDPVADFITTIRNGVRTRKESVSAPFSGLKASISKILVDEGFVESWDVVETKNNKGNSFKQIKIVLRYADELRRVSPITQLERVSRPGRRVYVRRMELPRVRGGYGISILSTSRGVLSDKEARRNNVGGELLVKVW
ncbi:MAG: 30S ribosomal protein S8 [Planctomycetales bacterium]|nr:30S ribosomal protein S8 [bacterium]UNM07926.1 MAG: 30S ribosomal protein S8 [Planctomycetales bacterium]